MPSDKKEKSFKKRFNTRRDIQDSKPDPGTSSIVVYVEEIDPVLRNMDANVIQKMNKDKDKSDQRVQEMEGSLELAMQTIRDKIRAIWQV